MTNTKFRKRALLSSVAMLLVALVALGSATFAWFSSTTSATAGTMEAKTSKSSNILLAEGKNGDTEVVAWDSAITFTQHTANTAAYGTTMTPVTTSDLATWKKALADDYNIGYNSTGASGLSPVSDIKSSAGYAKYTTLYIQSTTEDMTIDLNCNVTYPTGGNDQGKDFLRVGLKPLTTSDSVADAVFASGSAGASNIIFSDSGSSSNDVSSTGLWTSASTTANTVSNATFGTAVSLGAATAGKIYGYEVYVYYEGTDFNCKDQFAGTDLLVDFQITKH